MTAQAPVRPLRYPLSPGEHESLWGFIFRLSKHNLDESALRLRKRLELRGGKSNLSQAQFQRLSDISGVSVGALQKMQHLEQGQPRFFGHPWERRCISSFRSRICFDCVAEDGYHDRIFDLLFLTICPRHRKPLLEFCPECDRRLLWSRSAFGLCLEGHALIQPDASIKGPMHAERLIFERCGRALPGKSEVLSLPADLQQKSLMGQLTLFRFLGSLKLDFPYRKVRKKPNEELYDRAVLNAGFEMALSWPGSFTQWLEDRYEPSKKGPSDLGGGIHLVQMRLEKQVSEDTAGTLQKVFRDFAVSKNVFGRKGARWLPKIYESEDFYSLTRAAERMGATLRQTRKLAIEKGWIKPGPWQHSNMITVGRTSVEDWVRNFRKELSFDAAAKALRLDRTALQEIIDLRLLGFRRRWRSDEDEGAGQWRVEQGDILILVRCLEDRLRKPAVDEPSMSVRDFRKSHHLPNFNFGILLKAVVMNRLRPIGWTTELLLRDLQFNPHELRAFFESGHRVNEVRTNGNARVNLSDRLDRVAYQYKKELARRLFQEQ